MWQATISLWTRLTSNIWTTDGRSDLCPAAHPAQQAHPIRRQSEVAAHELEGGSGYTQSLCLRLYPSNVAGNFALDPAKSVYIVH